MGKLDELVYELAPRLKSLGYRKNGLTWCKDLGNVSSLFSIQRSQYSKEIWYFVFGICMHDITQKKTNSISACQITYRVEQSLPANGIEHLLTSWELRYGQISKLRRLAVEGKLPGIVSQEAIRYLTMVDITKI